MNEIVTRQTALECLTDILRAFPGCSEEFISLLSDRVVANGFTEPQLRRAVNHVIDNHTYGMLTIAEVIAAKPDDNGRICRWKNLLTSEARESTYAQYLADCNRYGKDNIKFLGYES